jgi:hypothetical protein
MNWSRTEYFGHTCPPLRLVRHKEKLWTPVNLDAGEQITIAWWDPNQINNDQDRS